MTPLRFDLVVVGASVAAEALVTRLREGAGQGEGFAGTILVIDRDPRMPYERPPLTKRYLTDPDDTDIAVEWESGVSVTLAEATHLDAERRELTVVMGGDGSTGVVGYEQLVIATGAAPIRLPIEPDGVLRLRRAEDADRIREVAGSGARVGIIGAGAIGVELATSMNALGCAVTLLDKADRPLERLLAGHLGSEVTGWLEGLGVDCRWGVDIEGIDGAPGDWSVRLGGGEELRFDALVGAVGARPVVGWLESSGLLGGDQSSGDERTGGQLVCDDAGRVLVPGGRQDRVFGIGDVVTRRFADGSLVRTESWSAAAEQGRQLADLLLGRSPAEAEISYFWTDVAGKKVQVLGALAREGRLWAEFENAARGAVLYRVAAGESAGEGGSEGAGEALGGGWIGINAPAQIAQRRMAGVGS